MEDPTLDLKSVGPRRTEPPASAPQRGETVGRYMVVDLLGMGGMGIVYKAFDPVLNRAIALKVLLLSEERRGGDHTIDQRRTRALREAQALAQLTHPNVVSIYDVGTEGDRLFMAMELIEGATLAMYLKNGAHTRPQVLEVLMAAGRGLAAAHQLGIVHRDFKPANVLIGKDGRVRVIDFGLARAGDHAIDEPGPVSAPLTTTPSLTDSDRAEPKTRRRLARPSTHDGSSEEEELLSSSANLLSSDMTQQGLVLGTPMYMAPEQQDGQPLDATADQFSFGVVLWEALYGVRPFEGESVEEVAQNARDHKLRRMAAAQVPPWLDAIATRALSPSPKARFGSMDELLAALADDPEQRRARVRAQRWRQLGVALASGVVGLSLFVAWRTHRQASQVCSGAEAKLIGVWDAPSKEALRKAFLATGKSFAPHALAGVSATLDRYAAAWTTMHTEACTASSVRHEQSAEILTLRMNCLQHRLGELRATTNVLANADVQVVQKAQEIADRLSSIAGCGDLVALTAPIAPPNDAPTRAKVEQLRDELAKAKVLGDAAKFAAGLSVAEAVVKEARTIGYLPLQAEAQLRQGILLNDLGRYEDAVRSMRQAFLDGLASKHSEVMLHASTELVVAISVGMAKLAEAEAWGEIAQAVMKSAPPNPEAESRWHNSMGVLYLNNGKNEQADQHLHRALALREKLTGPGAARAVGSTLLDLGVLADERGEHEQARQYYERALQLWEKELGGDHPSVASIVNNLGILAWEHGDYKAAEGYYLRASKIEHDAFGAEPPNIGLMLVNLGLLYHDWGREAEALDYYRRALAITEKLNGKQHTLLTWSLQGLGRLAAKRQQLDEARAYFERTLAICGSELCRGEEKHALAEADFGLAKILVRSKGNDQRARTLAEEARGFLRQIKAVGAKQRLAEVDAWLREHGA